MPVATKTVSLLDPTITQQTLYDALKLAFSNAGFGIPFSEFTSGTDKVIIYQFVVDATKTYGKTFIRVRVTALLAIGHQIYSTWNTANNTGASPSPEIVYPSLTNNSPIGFTSFSASPELYAVAIYQGGYYAVISFLLPSSRPYWWDLNAWNYGFMATSTTFTLFYSTALNPYGNVSYDTSLNSPRLSTSNLYTNRRDLIQGLFVFTQTNTGIAGKTSEDLVSVAATGMNRLDIIQVPGQTIEYTLINPASGGFAIRHQ